jgi:hypothetical protein
MAIQRRRAGAKSSGKIVSRLYTVTYIQRVGGKPVTTITLQSDSPFEVPVINQSIEIRHAGDKVSGLVTKMEFSSSTFRNGADYGSNEGLFVHVI